MNDERTDKWYEAALGKCIGEARFDASQFPNMGGYARYALNEDARSLIIETFNDFAGNLGGFLYIWLGAQSGGMPWRILQMGRSRVGPLPSVKDITLTVSPGAQGLIAVTMSAAPLGFGIYT